jgi:DNA repair photolyase
MPNWLYNKGESEWGEKVSVKENAAEVLEATLAKTAPDKRRTFRIFMASTTDPYQPMEAKHRITRACLDVFARYDDLDLLVIQTRSPLAEQDFDRMLQIPYVYLSLTIETDDQAVITRLGGGPTLESRFQLATKAVQRGIPTQITVSPCLPYTENFPARLRDTGVSRIVVDNFIEGDGFAGRRTANSRMADESWMNWRDVSPSEHLYQQLQGMEDLTLGWSSAGFNGIPPRAVRETIRG